MPSPQHSGETPSPSPSFVIEKISIEAGHSADYKLSSYTDVDHDTNHLLWSTLAGHIRYMYISAAPTSGHGHSDRSHHSRAEKNSFWLSTHDLKKILLFCGVKTHRCTSAVQHFFTDFFSQCYPPPTPLGESGGGGGGASGEQSFDGDEGKKGCGGGPHARRGRAPLVVVKRVELSLSRGESFSCFPEEALLCTAPSLVDRAVGGDASQCGTATTISLEELLVAHVSASSASPRVRLEEDGSGGGGGGRDQRAEGLIAHHKSSGSMFGAEEGAEGGLLGCGSPRAPKAEYIFVIDAHYFEEQVIHLLTTELRGQMITRFPFARFTAASLLLVGQGGGAAATTAAAGATTPTRKTSHKNASKVSARAQPNTIAGLVVFLSGTSGTGKSTLSSLLAAQLSIDEVVSTDTIRQVQRLYAGGSNESKQDSAGACVPLACPELFYSTYDAYRAMWVAEDAAAATAAVKPAGGSLVAREREPTSGEVITSYKKQCHCVLASLDKFLDRYFSASTTDSAGAQSTTTNRENVKRRTLLVEGVHLLPSYLKAKQKQLMRKQVVCINVLARIKKEERHRERFCVRSRGMVLSLKAEQNKYVSAFRFIRMIQNELLAEATTQSSAEEYPFMLSSTEPRGTTSGKAQQQQRKGREALSRAASSTSARVNPYTSDNNNNNNNNHNNTCGHRSSSYDTLLILNNTNIDKSLSYVHRAVLHFVESVSLFGWSGLLWREETVEPPVKEKKMLSILHLRYQQHEHEVHGQGPTTQAQAQGSGCGDPSVVAAIPTESGRSRQREGRDRAGAPLFFQTSGLSRARSAQQIEHFQQSLLQQSRAAANAPADAASSSLPFSFFMENADNNTGETNSGRSGGGERLRKKNEMTSTAASTGVRTVEGKSPADATTECSNNKRNNYFAERMEEMHLASRRMRAHSSGHAHAPAKDTADGDCHSGDVDDDDDDLPSLIG